MAQELVTFKDLHDYVVEESNVSANNASASNRINRTINIVYEDITVPHRWRWLEATSSTVVPKVYRDGLVSVTAGSATVTGNATVSFAASMVGRKMYFDTESAEYTISSVTDATNAILAATYRGTDITSQAFRIYQDMYTLPTDCEEVIEVYHRQSNNIRHQTRKPITRRQMHDFKLRLPTHEYFAQRWSHAIPTASGTRVLWIWPPGYTTQDYRLHFDYTKRITSLSASTDEPLMPKTYRSVLAYGALEHLFAREGNLQRAAWAKSKFAEKFMICAVTGKLRTGDHGCSVPWRYRERLITPGRYDLGAHFDNDTWRDDY